MTVRAAEIIETPMERLEAEIREEAAHLDAPAGASGGDDAPDERAASRSGLAAVETIPTESVPVVHGDPGRPETAEQARADALVVLAETMLAAGPTPHPGGAPTEIVVHVDADALAEGGSGVFEDGPNVDADMVRQLLCDCGVVAMIEDSKGRTIDVGRRRPRASGARGPSARPRHRRPDRPATGPRSVRLPDGCRRPSRGR